MTKADPDEVGYTEQTDAGRLRPTMTFLRRGGDLPPGGVQQEAAASSSCPTKAPAPAPTPSAEGARGGDGQQQPMGPPDLLQAEALAGRRAAMEPPDLPQLASRRPQGDGRRIMSRPEETDSSSLERTSYCRSRSPSAT